MKAAIWAQPMTMNKPGLRGFARVVAATGYSLRGLRAAWRWEEAFRVEAILGLILLPAAFWVGQSLLHQLVLIIAFGIVVVAELVNSAIEAIVDRIGMEPHPLSGQAKDLGSATVFVSTLLCGLVWGLSLWQRLAAT